MMPKPNQPKENNHDNPDNASTSNERVLLETKPNMLLYSNNFVLKIVVLFLLVFLFAPLITLFYNIQTNLLDTFQLNFENMTFIMELVLLFCILIVIIKIILDVLDWNYTLYKLTPQRIIIQRGFFRKEKVIMSYNKIQDIEVSQSIIERILNTGDIIVYGGHDNSETILDEVPNPKKVEDLIIQCMNTTPHDYNRSYNQDYNRGYNSNYDREYSQDYNRGYDSSYSREYSQNNNYNKNQYDSHYDDSRFSQENTHYNNTRNIRNDNKYRKGRRNNERYERVEIDENEIINKHQQRFKKYKK